MQASDFRTVADGLLHVALALGGRFADEGFDLVVEEEGLGFPFTPTFVARRGHETVIVELSSEIDKSRMIRWAKFARSQSSDTRIVAVVARESAYNADTSEFCEEHRCGLFAFEGPKISELRAPIDLALQLDLPDLSDYSPKVRKALAGPFKKIKNGEWRDGLGDIYLAIEELAREYLKTGIERTRISIPRKKGGHWTPEQIDSLPLGEITARFREIPKKNQQDSLIEKTLVLLNPNRVKLIHKRLQKDAEVAIRREAGMHAYAAINCIAELLK